MKPVPSIAVTSRPRRAERGYILITLMLFVSLLAIASLVVLPEITFQVQRDREEELIHRGVQYSRAIKKYVKKFNRYPTRLEDLENTNNIRTLRKRYKDPITGQDFKLLHFGEVQMMGSGFHGGIPGGGVPGVNGAPGANPPNGVLGGRVFGPAPGLGPGGVPNPNSAALAPATAPTQETGGGEIDAEQQQIQAENQAAAKAQADQNADHADNDNGPAPAGQVFGGGPIVGVASTSKKKSIREFNKKDHYNKWQFIYDPGTDKGGLLTTPSQPPLQTAAPNVSGNKGGAGFGQSNPPAPPPSQPPDQQQQ